jgi:hypothetical protein
VKARYASDSHKTIFRLPGRGLVESRRADVFERGKVSQPDDVLISLMAGRRPGWLRLLSFIRFAARPPHINFLIIK